MPGYDEMKKGMEFIEVNPPKGRKARIIILTETGLYNAMAKVIEGPGSKSKRSYEIQVWNKALSDPTRWKLIEGGNAKTVLM